MQEPKKPSDTKQPGTTLDSSTPAPEDDYRDQNSGRRAAGHGGGDMDEPEEFPDAHRETGYEYSGGGQGHEANRSLARETDEDLESRSGPYTRAGQPAQPRVEAEDAESGKGAADKSSDSKK